MPVQDPFQLPESVEDLPVPNEEKATFFLNFISSTHPETKESWCPDVRAALPIIGAAFAAEGTKVGYVHVGQRPEWKDLTNVHRTKWNVNAVPTLVRYQRVNGEVKETGRLVESELLDQMKLVHLVAGQTESVI
ncbi:hypothetical protein N0V90_011220 [Kalmusia sp. IMI 367209]|nr:hypothetical protein N0V90_011220 [Kalmusia sp. IMI 367209]